MRNVYAIATAFFFIFFGFGTGQQYLVVLFNEQGRGHLALVTLLILYIAFLLTGIIVPKLIQMAGGLKRSLLLGASAYAIFTASIAINNTPLLFLCAAIIGVGAGLLWVSSGQIITDSAPKDQVSRGLSYQVIGMYSGNIIGIIAGGYLIRVLPLGHVYLTLAVVIAIGVMVLFIVKESSGRLSERPFRPSYLWNPLLASLFPLIFGAYFLQGQVFTGLNLVIVNLLGISLIPLIVSIVKIANILGSFSSGALADHFDKTMVLLSLIAIALTGVVFFMFTSSLASYTIGALLLGFSMAAIYPVTLAALKETIPNEEYLYALGTFNVYTNVGTLGSIASNFVLPVGLTFIPGALALMVAIAGIFVFKSLTAGSHQKVS